MVRSKSQRQNHWRLHFDQFQKKKIKEKRPSYIQSHAHQRPSAEQFQYQNRQSPTVLSSKRSELL